MLQDQHEGERSGDNRAQHRQATCKIGTEERRPLETCWFFLLKKFFPHSFRAVVQKTRILYSQSGRKDESYTKIIQLNPPTSLSVERVRVANPIH